MCPSLGRWAKVMPRRSHKTVWRSLWAAFALAAGFSLPAVTRAEDEIRDQGGISTPLLSRCAGKFGAQLRAADNAFPLLSLMGVPWMTIERTDQTVDGAHIVAIVTGTGMRTRRRGQILGLSYRCLIDDRGEAASFTWHHLLPERSESLPPAKVARGTAYYQPRTQLPLGAELRAQLLDQAQNPSELLTEAVVRSAWEEPIPFSLRLPPDMKLEGRKLAIAVRLARGSAPLYGLKEPQALDLNRLQRPIELTIDSVVAGSSREVSSLRQ
jgi:uncharacterized lipoprotein YbaY